MRIKIIYKSTTAELEEAVNTFAKDLEAREKRVLNFRVEVLNGGIARNSGLLATIVYTEGISPEDLRAMLNVEKPTYSTTSPYFPGNNKK